MLKINRIKNQRIIGLLIFFFFAFAILPLEAQDKLEVQGKLTIKGSDTGAPRYGLVLKPLDTAPSGQEGRLYYHDRFYYYNGDWSPIGSGATTDRYVATKIVSAYNSAGATRDETNPCLGDGTTCNNPKADYTCNGTDDQVEIQQAIDALGTTGGAVYLLEGTYNMGAAINLDNTAPDDSGKAIIGAGKGTVLKIISDASNVNVINASTVNRILISQLMITDANTTGVTNRGINFSAVTYSKIDKVWLQSIRGYGIYLLSSSNNNTIFSNNAQSNGGNGIYLSSSNNNTISHNNVQSNGGHGIIIESSSNNTISNNNAQSNTNNGIYLSSSNNNTISNNNAQSNTNNGIYLLSSSNNNTISNNNVQANTQNGIYLSPSSTNAVTANVIYDNGGSGAYDGIKLDSNSNNNIISSNRIYDSEPVSGGGYGINLSANTNYLTGNLIDGAGYISSAIPPTYDRRIQDLGTGNKYTDKAKITLEQITLTGSSVSSLDAAVNPKGYVALNPSANITLTLNAGKSAGDMLVLENISPSCTIFTPCITVTVNDSGNVNLSTASKVLKRFDTLELIWNGLKWLEVSYSNNYSGIGD